MGILRTKETVTLPAAAKAGDYVVICNDTPSCKFEESDEHRSSYLQVGSEMNIQSKMRQEGDP